MTQTTWFNSHVIYCQFDTSQVAPSVTAFGLYKHPAANIFHLGVANVTSVFVGEVETSYMDNTT